jgi:hypothetical protein
VFGALIISACVATMGLRKWRAQNREEAEAAAARAVAAAQAQKDLERAVPAAAHLITTPEEAQELSLASGTPLARLRPLSVHDDDDAGDGDDGVMMRKYSLELDASDVIVHEGSYSSPPTATNAASSSPSYAAVPAPPATARARLL